MKKLSWKDAALRVLTAAGEPLHYAEITQRILDDGLKATAGATPADSLNATICVSITNEGPSSPFVRHGRGVYRLRDTPPPADSDVAGPMSAFGIHWQRDLVQWTARPRLFGRQHAKADRVDLAEQQGVYLLHGIRGDTVYVGQAKLIGRRLAQHTLDRLANRWTYFSWFGIRAVDENGKLADSNGVADPAMLVDAIESVLIEAIEPRQNRQRGTSVGSEFIQAVDPRL